MNVLQAGYLGFSYSMVKELRRKGIESDILTSKQYLNQNTSNPEDPRNFDEKLDSLPEWIHVYDLKKVDWKIKVLKEMRKYDLIHSNMEMPIFAMLSHKKYIAQSIGDDLRDLAFRNSIKGRLLRRAYNHADMFIFSWPPHKSYVEKLQLENVKFIPWLWSTQIFSNHQKKEHMKNNVLTLFHPMTQNWEMKGNDKFLRAFVKICKEKKNIFLYLVLWGPNEKDALELLSIPEVNEHIEIIKGPISRQKMIEFMSKSDVIVEQFNSGSFTRVGMEAMEFGLPVLMNLDEESHNKLYGECPVVINSKQDYIYEKLVELIESKIDINFISNKAKEWFTKYYDNNKIIEKYIEVYECILKK